MPSKKLDCKHITSVTQLRRCGFGVDAIVKLKQPYINKFSGEDIGPPVGTKGRIVGTFGSRPTIIWDAPGKYGQGEQVVEPEMLKVVKRSAKPEIIATVSLERLKKFQSDYRTVDIKDSKVLVWKDETVFDEVGFDVGTVFYEMRGKIKGDKVEFTSTRIDMSGIPRREHYGIRTQFESDDPKQYFPIFEE